MQLKGEIKKKVRKQNPIKQPLPLNSQRTTNLNETFDFHFQQETEAMNKYIMTSALLLIHANKFHSSQGEERHISFWTRVNNT